MIRKTRQQAGLGSINGLRMGGFAGMLLVLVAVTVTANTQASQQVLPVDFTLPDLDGKSRKLSEFRGQWVVVNFWATWCGPCVREIPELNRFYNAHKHQGVEVVGVNYEELTRAQVQKAAKEFAIEYLVLWIGDSPEMSAQMVLKGLPSTFVISPDGMLVKTWLGPVDEKQLAAFLAPRLRGKVDEMAAFKD